MNLKSVISVLLISTTAVFGADNDVSVMRDGLPNACRLWRGTNVHGMVFYIGCTTATPRGNTRNLFAASVRKVFPGAKGVATFLAWGWAYPDNCSSIIETFRAMSDGPSVAAEGNWPFVAMTLIDLSDEDIGMPENHVRAAVEGFICRTREHNKGRDMLVLHQPDERFVADYKAGKTPGVIKWYEEIAEHYGVPSVNLAKAAAQKTDWKGTQPEKEKLLSECVEDFLKQYAAQPAQANQVKHPLPKRMMPSAWNMARLINYDRGEMDLTGWLGWQLSPIERIFHVATCSKPGPVMSIDFTGTAAGVYGITGPDSGDLEYSIDGGQWQPVKVFNPDEKDGKFHLFHRMFVDNLENKKHKVSLRVAETMPRGSTGRQARIGWFTVNGSDASPMGTLKPIELADTIFLQLDPITYQPPKNRWALIPKTMKRLREGSALKMVMLGDSIINNIQSSNFNLLLERIYPKCKIEKIVSVRGSTGCWYYQEPANLESYVLKHKPDLLVIGGISQRGDVEAIRSVIKQTRAALPDVEVIVMTDVFGSKQSINAYDPKTAADPDPNGEGYRDRLLKMAQEEKVEYINLTQPWARFLMASKQPLGAFMSDSVHANSRGCQLIGRFLELYFAPDGWDARKAAETALSAGKK